MESLDDALVAKVLELKKTLKHDEVLVKNKFGKNILKISNSKWDEIQGGSDANFWERLDDKFSTIDSPLEEPKKNGCFFNLMGFIILFMGTYITFESFDNKRYGALIFIIGISLVIYSINRLRKNFKN